MIDRFARKTQAQQEFMQRLGLADLRRKMGLSIDRHVSSILDQLYAQPAEVRILSDVIHPCLMPYVRTSMPRQGLFRTLYDAGHEVNKMFHYLKEHTPCNYDGVSFTVNGAFVGTHRAVHALWNGDIAPNRLAASTGIKLAVVSIDPVVVEKYRF